MNHEPVAMAPVTLGRFEVIGRLGQGAQSVVYLAYDPQLHREVALKTVQFDSNEGRRAALLAEARSVSRLSHPAIVPVFEALETAHGSCLVFEYVPGRTLAERLAQEGAMPAAEAVLLLLPVLDALAYAHGQRIVHRDLKPSNILLDDAGRARVMDFGIAVRHGPGTSQAGDDDASDPMVAMLGTPAYMAPEFAGAGQVGPAMDQFSIALVLCEMLTGQRLVGALEGVRAIRFLLNNDLALPAQTPLPVDDDLRAIVERALARRPEARFADIATFAQALRAWLDPAAQLPRAEDEMARAAALDALLDRMPAPDALLAAPWPGVGMPLSAWAAAVWAGLDWQGAPNHDAPARELLRERCERARLAGLLARELSGLGGADGDEALVCGWAQHLGRMALAASFPDEARTVLAPGAGARHGLWAEELRAAQQLGTGLQALGEALARRWGLPETVQRCTSALRPAEVGGMPATRGDLLRLCASMAGELADAQALPDPDGREAALLAALAHYGAALCLRAHDVRKALAQVMPAAH